MQHRWKILAPVDLGSQAEARVHHALNIAEATQGDLSLLYVVNERSKRAIPVEWPSSAMGEDGHGNLRRLVLAGPVGETIGRSADDLGVDLVTVTDTVDRWWKPLWGRSGAGRIAAATDRPVCFVRMSAPAPTAFRSILCVVRLDGTDDALLRFSEELAKRSDATLVLLHVLPEVSEALLAYGIPGVEDRPLSREVAEQRLKELTGGLSRPYLTAITTGSAYRAIPNLAREHKADVVITSRTDGALSDLDAGRVLSRVSCPVITVPVAIHSVLGSTADQGHLCAV